MRTTFRQFFKNKIVNISKIKTEKPKYLKYQEKSNKNREFFKIIIIATSFKNSEQANKKQ